MRPAFLSAALCALLGCEGSHNDLGVEPTTAGTGGGAAAGGAGGGGAGGQAQGGAPPIVEPDGPARLTVIHGIVDRPSLQLCFAASPADPEDDAAPWPSSPLAFARAALISELPGAPLPASSAAEILVLTGDLDAASGATCRELADDPEAFPGLEVLSLGAAPVASLTSPRSLALAVTGCFGGAGHDDPGAELSCGAGYTSLTPTPSIVLAPLSRFSVAGAIGFQIVNATTGGSSLDGHLQPAFDGVPFVPIASLVVPGQAAPFPPSSSISASGLGSASQATLRVVSAPAGQGLELSLGEAMEAGGVEASDLANGQNVALVAVGAAPGAPALAWSNGFAVVAVDAEPAR